MVETLKHKEEISQELNKVLTHSLFKGARRSSSFLRYVCEKTLAGESHQIKEFSIAVDAFGLEMSFDQQMDPRIRVEAKRLRDRLNQYYEGPGSEDPVIIKMEKGSYIPCFRIPHNESEVPSDSENEDIQAVMLDNRFLIHFDLHSHSNGDSGDVGLLISQIIHQLFLQGQKDSRELPLSELIELQEKAFPLVLTIKHHFVSDMVHLIFRLKLEQKGTLIHSKELGISTTDLRNEDKVKIIIQQETKELVDFCRSVRS